MNIVEELLWYEGTATFLMVGLLVVRRVWRERPAVGWDPELLCWRSARAIYKERRWR